MFAPLAPVAMAPVAAANANGVRALRRGVPTPTACTVVRNGLTNLSKGSRGAVLRCQSLVEGSAALQQEKHMLEDIKASNSFLYVPQNAPTGTNEGGGADSQLPPLDELGVQWKNMGYLGDCEPEKVGQGLKIAVLLSGGVDSSVALSLLRAAGHDCTCFYLQIWFQEDFRNTWDSCPWEEDLQFAKDVCERAEVDLHVIPLTNQYWDRVVSHSVDEMREGRTPNPDMLCNSRIKFG